MTEQTEKGLELVATGKQLELRFHSLLDHTPGRVLWRLQRKDEKPLEPIPGNLLRMLFKECAHPQNGHGPRQMKVFGYTDGKLLLDIGTGLLGPDLQPFLEKIENGMGLQ